jgi:hypothetical protein
MEDEMPKDDELVALRERVETLEDVCRLLVQKAQELETCVVSLHERASLQEACAAKERDLLREITTAVEFLLKRGGKPPGPAAPLSGVN